MINLVFCSFEVGGFPFKIAEILNNHGIKTYYVAISNDAGHDSSAFHYDAIDFEWNLSGEYKGCDRKLVVKQLENLKKEKKINCCFATGSSAYLLSEAGIEYYYWSYGSDLDLECFYPFNGATIYHQLVYLKYIVKKIQERINARKSIVKAKSIMISPYQIAALDKVYPTAKRFFLPHYFESKYPNFDALFKAKLNAKKELCEKYGVKSFLFSSTRHYWYGNKAKMSDNKGNDVIVETFAEYVSLLGNRNVALIFVAKGPDVSKTTELISKYGLSKNVYWVDEMKRSDLERYYLGSEYCFGQFGTNVLTNSVLEPLLFGGISISSDNSQPGGHYYSELPPIINANNPKKIASLMMYMDQFDEYKRELMRKSYQWIINNCSYMSFVNAYSSLL